jgi:3D-(3,5/4)-trihydroxycyclohexane-1,2-dione acylhydrolase (decyclizing)
VGPIGVTGSDHANRLARAADLVLAVGTRLQDFTTGSWTVFGEQTRIVGLNSARFDASKHLAAPLVADAREGLSELAGELGEWRCEDTWTAEAAAEAEAYRRFVAEVTAPDPHTEAPTYAQVIGAVHGLARPDDYVLTAAGGFPGELNVNWLAKGVGTFDCEYGFSCMGYEIAGAWGARMARREGEVICFVGDGSYLMLNSELYSSVLSRQKLIVVLCDNGGYAVIDRLQAGEGGAPFNNLFRDVAPDAPPVDWAAHARALGCEGVAVTSLDELGDAVEQARAADRTTVVAIRTDPHAWTPGGAFWEVGVPEVAHRPEIEAARRRLLEGKAAQRVGW